MVNDEQGVRVSRIAYLGTGLLGSGFVEAALGRGDQVTVWNRTAAKAEALVPFGAVVAATPAEAVTGAERVHLVLPDDAVVEAVIASLRPGLSPTTIVLDHSTTLPEKTAARSVRLNADGVRYLHCPVFIGPAAARQSTGTIMVSGPEALYEAVAAALAVQATKVEYFGERPDLAAVYKLCGNALILGITAVMADTYTVARGGDVAPADVLAKLQEYFNAANIVAGRGKSMAEAKYAPGFELTMARKDVQLMLETAGDAPLTSLPGIAARMDALIAQGYGHEDLAALGRDAITPRTSPPR
jgi:3-hydroxyisobutyrate dehydrogenase-like beta-hydroxyacid dehydrogenase